MDNEYKIIILFMTLYTILSFFGVDLGITIIQFRMYIIINYILQIILFTIYYKYDIKVFEIIDIIKKEKRKNV